MTASEALAELRPFVVRSAPEQVGVFDQFAGYVRDLEHDRAEEARIAAEEAEAGTGEEPAEGGVEQGTSGVASGTPDAATGTTSPASSGAELDPQTAREAGVGDMVTGGEGPVG